MFDFSKNTQLDKLDNVPEQFRGAYQAVEAEGGEEGESYYVINDASKGLVEAVIGLNGSLQKERQETKALRGSVDLSELANYGKTPSEIKASIETKLEELNAQIGEGNEAKINLDKIKADIQAGHKVELESHQNSIERLRTQLHNEIVGREITESVANANGEVGLVKPILEKEVRTVEEDGMTKVYIVDDSGDIRYSSVTGKELSIEERVSEMKNDAQYGRLFNSPLASAGGGAGTSPTSTTSPSVGTSPANLSPNAKIAAALGNL